MVTEVEPEAPLEFYSDREREEYEKKQKKLQKEIVDGFISRSFVYNILQGVVEHSSILPLPAGVTLGRQSEYVLYSVADMWITDNRFGSFTDIIEKCNSKITKGDSILTVQRLRPEHYYDGRSYIWGRTTHQENVRGRGYNNRTHDVAADDCTIYSVNLVERKDPVRMIRYRYKSGGTWYDAAVEVSNKERLSSGVEREFLDEYMKTFSPKVFISLEKDYSECGAKSNFEIHSDEYINLQYMNSCWLSYVICNKTLGNWRIGGENVNYAYAIRYLKTALDFIRKREAREKEHLDAVDPAITCISDWQVSLSEWKMEKGVREITPYQAKRFAKYMSAAIRK